MTGSNFFVSRELTLFGDGQMGLNTQHSKLRWMDSNCGYYYPILTTPSVVTSCRRSSEITNVPQLVFAACGHWQSVDRSVENEIASLPDPDGLT